MYANCLNCGAGLAPQEQRCQERKVKTEGEVFGRTQAMVNAVDEKRRGAERRREGEGYHRGGDTGEKPERALETYCQVLSYKVVFIRSTKVTWS